MSFEYDLPGIVTTSVLTPSVSVAANTNSLNFDLLPYQGAVGVILNGGAASAGTNPVLQAAIYDSADNSTFAAITNATFTNVTNANSLQVYDLDTRTARRYMRVVMTVSGTNSPAFPVGLSVFGVKEYVPNAV